MKALCSIFLILSLLAPAPGYAAMAEDAGCCDRCSCAAASCCESGADEAGSDAPFSLPAGQTRVTAPGLAILPVDFFLRALDGEPVSPVFGDRLLRLPKQQVSPYLRNCAFLI